MYFYLKKILDFLVINKTPCVYYIMRAWNFLRDHYFYHRNKKQARFHLIPYTKGHERTPLIEKKRCRALLGIYRFLILLKVCFIFHFKLNLFKISKQLPIEINLSSSLFLKEDINSLSEADDCHHLCNK